MAQEEILYERAHVAVRDCFPSKDSSPNRSKDITGKVSIVETSQGIFFRFKPTGLDDRPTDDWALVSETNSIVSYKNSGQERDSIAVTPNPLLKYRFNINLNNIRSIKRNQLLHGITYLTFVLKDGTTLPIFYFNLGGTKELVHLIQIYIHLEKSSDDAQLYIVKDENVSAFDQLNLFDNSNDMLKRIRGTHTRRTAMDKFSKLTNFVRDTVLGQNEIIRTGDNLDDAITPDLTALMESFSAELRESNNDGFEVIYKVDFKKLPKVNRGSPLTSQEWAESLDEKGRVIDVKQLKERIFRGGLESNELRREVWKFLLNFYSWSSTKRERIELAKQREAEYFAMKLQWKSMNDRQKKRNTLFRDRESLIDKDVIRTDRTHEYFEGERNPHLEILHDILMTYNMFNFDLGYVQGMNDLLSPILIVMENEVDAFWCFAGLMERMQKNFHMDQSHIKRQLGNLHTLLQFIDAELANYLVENNSSNMYFFFRWMLICFKREFSFEDVMYLWEVLWTDNLCENFELLVCLAILISQKSAIMESKLGCCEILKHINDLSLKVALEPLLEHAEGLFILLKQHEQTSPGLPPSISAIMFPKPTNNDENGNDSEGVSPVSSTKSSRDPSPVITTDVVERKTRTRHLTESHSIDENDSAVVSHSQKA